MKTTGKLIAAAVLVAAGVAPAFAGDFDREFKARQSLMQLNAWNIGVLGAMAKGDMPYDAAAAQTAADHLVALTAMIEPAMWPKGSDVSAFNGKTRAKPEIWADGSEFGAKKDALSDAAAKMAAVAGTGLEAVQGEIKNLGGACGACHKMFRQDQ